MANIHDCLQVAMEGNEIDKERGTRAQQEYNQLLARYETIMPRAQAEVAAAGDLKEALRASARSRRHKVLAQLQALKRMTAAIDASKDPGEVLMQFIEWSPNAQKIGFTGESIASVRNALIKSINGEIGDVLRQTGLNLTGRSRDPAKVRNIIRELHGQATGDTKAVELADAIRSQQERMRTLFNANGGDIGKLDNYGVAHTHNAAKIRKAGLDKWREDIIEELDWSRITNHKTGKPFSEGKAIPRGEDVQVFLGQIFESIRTDGWNVKDPSMSVGGRALYNKNSDSRVLHFKDGDAWMRYNERYGASDPFTAMVGGLHGIARDVAMMRVLGPNPTLGLEFASQAARKKAALSKETLIREVTDYKAKRAATMLAHVSGQVSVPESKFYSSFFSGTRQVLTGIQLGSAPLSAVTDIVTMRVAARVVGLNPNSLMSQVTKLIRSSEAREMAASAGYIADSLADMGSAGARYTGETFAPELAGRIAGVTLKASGLNFWTDMNRVAFQMEFAAFLGNSAQKSYDNLHPNLKTLFEQRGITASDWDKLRADETLYRPKGDAVFLTPKWFLNNSNLERAEAEGLAMRLQMMIEEQMEFAVPTANIRGRSLMVGDTKPGSIIGEIARSFTMYKGFALSLTLNQIRRYQNLPPSMTRAEYAFRMSAGLLIMGGVAVQLKEVAKGNDPRPMNEEKFWMGALFQGGGLGIFGDFFASETSRAGGGLAETIAGPVVGVGADLLRIANNGLRAASGESTYFGRDVANFQRYNTPLLSSLWYGRLAYDRLVSDEVQRLLDPDAESLWRRAEKRRLKDYGTRTWWERGENFPERAPDLSNALGDN